MVLFATGDSFCCYECLRTMAAPKPKAKRTESETTSPVTPSPSTPANSEAENQQDGNKRRRRSKTAEEQLPLTPMQKASDMMNKCLKKKSDASNLALTLQPIAYADALSTEMQSYATKFQLLNGNLCMFLKPISPFVHLLLAIVTIMVISQGPVLADLQIGHGAEE